ncbi:MAG: glycolate oxidase subunit GlcE [Rhodocyclaceae bacterium]|nr:glycolate oxidase subunit GlcE [Rhodocyclaceae bacterium]
MDAILNDWSEQIRAAGAAGRKLRLRGGGSKDFYGNALAGEVVDTGPYAGIVAYEPTELVITARCGTPMAELEAALADKGQCLAFEPPSFGAATLGGAVAAGLSGPRRAAVGSLRDFVLGVKIIDGDGRQLSFGGQVMKNVAGYDVSRLMAGSLGTLGLIAEVSLKVLPLPVAEATLRFELPEERALEAMNRWAGQPLPISASCWQEDVLTLRLSGAAAAVGSARQALGGESVPEAEAQAFWRGLREQTADFFADADQGEPLWRVSLPSVAGHADLPGRQLIEWGGSQRWARCGAEARQVRAMAEALGGTATLFRGGDKSVGVFHPLAPANLAIHRRLKQAFDPKGVFNPGRFYAEL